MKRTLLLLLLVFNLNIFAQEFVKNEMLVQIDESISPTELFRNFEQSQNLSIHKVELISNPMRIYLVKFNQNIDHHLTIRAFKSTPHVLNVQNNHLVYERETIPNDADFTTEQWYFKNTGQSGGTIDADIDVTDAWDISTGGVTTHNDSIVICIIEGSGVDIFHEDIKDNIWKNYAEIPDNGIDDDNNGYVDDFYGWNVISNDDAVGSGSHGTRVAGMVGAKGNNGIGISGVNQDVKMMVVKGQQASNEASVIAAYTYPLEMRKKYNQTNGAEGAFVVATNSSWGLDGGNPANSPLWCAMYDTLGHAGIINVGATTNNNDNVDVVGDLPSTCPSDYLIAVTMTNNVDARAGSGYGPINVDLGAPGFGVYLPVPTDIYTTTSGTSFATPCVSGSIGLLYSTPCPDFINWAKAYPDSSALKAKAYILNNVDPIVSLTNDVSTGGRLNINNAMLNLMSDCDPNSCIAPFNLSYTGLTDTSITINWSGFSNDFLFYIQEGNQTLMEHPISSQTNLTLDTLKPCTNYTVYIKAICSATDTSIYSYPLAFKTDGCCDNPDLTVHNETENSLDIQWENVLYASDYTLRYKALTATNWTELTNATSATTINGLDACTEYEFQIKTTCTDSTHGFSPSFIFKTKGCGACYDLTYCPVDGANPNFEWIESVSFAGSTNTTGSNNGWLIEENVIFSILPNSSNVISITPGYAGTNYTENYTVWIDIDQNGSFDLSDKLLTGLSNNGPVSGVVSLPSFAQNGITKMRIGMTAINQPLECPNTSFYGEYEDYCIYIGPDASIQDVQTTNISIYPNPARTNLFIDCPSPIESVEVFTIDGKKVDLLTTNTSNINVSHLPNGIYLVKVQTENQTQTIKFIKQ